MRQRVAKAGFDDLLGEQAQAPARVAFGRIATGECRHFRPLTAINADRSSGARCIVEAGQSLERIPIAPTCHGDGTDVQGLRHSLQGFAAVKFEQGGGTLEGLRSQAAFGQLVYQCCPVAIRQGQVLLFHAPSLPDL